MADLTHEFSNAISFARSVWDHVASASREGVSDSAIACALVEAGRALATFDKVNAWPISLDAAPVARLETLAKGLKAELTNVRASVKAHNRRVRA
jgi:hypothetical protein